MKGLKKVFENEHVYKVKKFQRLIDDYVYKSFYHIEQNFNRIDKLLPSFKSAVKSVKSVKPKEFFLRIVK